MVTRTFTSGIMWNCSKFCTKTWEKQLWRGVPGIFSDHLCSITEPWVLHRGDRVTTQRASQPHWLPEHEDSWPTCLSSNRVQAGRRFSSLDMEYSISDCKKEPFSELGLAKRCRGTRSSWPLSWVLCPLQWERWFLPCELTESYLPRTQHSTGPPANWGVSAPELPQQLQGLNLRPWSPASNLLESAISNATAQILLLTQDEELRGDFGQIMS